MLDGKSIYAYQAVFADNHIIVRNIGFDPSTGLVRLAIDENHENVGLYHIAVTFGSGSSTGVDYDGGNSHRDKRPIVRTEKQYDTLKEIKVARVPTRASADPSFQVASAGANPRTASCELYEKLQSHLKSAQEKWAYFTYPQYKMLRGTSDRKSKQLARETQNKMREIRQRMGWHRQDCDVCKGLTVSTAPN
jgi:hypothetical protein